MRSKSTTVGPNMAYVIFLAFVAGIGGFLYGYDTAVISGTISMVTERFSLDAIAQGWYVGCALVGSIAGVACAGVISDWAGRRNTMILSAVLFTSSAVGCAVAQSFDALVFYRIIGGVGIGVVSIVSPLYISEVSVARYRGQLVSFYQTGITVGFLGAYLANYGLLLYSPTAAQSASSAWSMIFGTECWRGMLGMETLPAVIFLITIFFIPESPRWLVLRHKDKGAFAVLKSIYVSDSGASEEMSSIRQSIDKSTDKGAWKQLFRRPLVKPLFIGVTLAILGQFMGVNAVLYYGPTIFEESGLSSGDSLFYQVLVGAVNMGTSILALFIIDKVGRKKLVYFGVTGMIVSLLFIAVYFLWGTSLGLGSVFLLVFFLAYIFCCAISICAVIWVLLSELYPTAVRGVAMSIAGFSLWIGTYLIGQLTPVMLQGLTPAGTFLLFACMCVPYLLIVRFLLPDTTGVSLEQIENLWSDEKN